uniref:Uncharacterized protein n=1 Tax=Picea sitchensis TaxID=3332 RepID=C0PSY6_PICSI|nr:unknown [Picea sitchensis]
MDVIKFPQNSEKPVENSNGYWITKWDGVVNTSREGSENSPASKKILNYVTDLLENIVPALNKNFSRLYAKTESSEAKLKSLSLKIEDTHKILDKEDGEKQEELHSEIEDMGSKIDSMEATLKQLNSWFSFAIKNRG